MNKYPYVLPDNSMVFQIYAPEAESVAVMGDLPWDKPASSMVPATRLCHIHAVNATITSGLAVNFISSLLQTTDSQRTFRKQSI